MKSEDDWNEDDATWKLLEKSKRIQASGRFADDTVRAVRLLPERDSWWAKFVSASPWVGVAACGALAALFFIQQPEVRTISDGPIASSEEKWGEIEEVAQTEMLSAAVDHLDQFSDQELVTLIGF